MEKTNDKKIFAVQFNIIGNQIQTQMKMDKVSPQEAIGLLEMAKDQILEKLKTGRKDVFEASKK
jgi:hypothetical protein